MTFGDIRWRSVTFGDIRYDSGTSQRIVAPQSLRCRAQKSPDDAEDGSVWFGSVCVGSVLVRIAAQTCPTRN